MPTTNQFQLAIQALQELTPELNQPEKSGINNGHHSSMKGLPTVFEVIKELDPIPHSSIFLGMASDGLPILLNLFDPKPGPILITGEAGAGKTRFLMTVALAVSILHDPKSIRYGVVTSQPEIWEDIQRHRNCLGIFPVGTDLYSTFLHNVYDWMQSKKNDNQSILMLVDDLEQSIPQERSELQRFHKILLNGPRYRLWPFVTLDAKYFRELGNWNGLFETKIFGHISDVEVSQQINIPISARVNELNKGNQFTLPERNYWLKFWLPAFDE